MFNKDIEDAINFYVKTIANTSIQRIQKAPADYPSGKKGDVLVIECTIDGIPCIAVNGGDHFKHSEAFSFQIATETQEQTDKLWNAIVDNGGEESMCGWCKDKWGISWQITPTILTNAMRQGGEVAEKAFVAMMEMKKIDIAAIKKAIS
jgi:predicted 3-demethylubiquinone-9 3-methyltransferase (glyoxalase superfamily)